MSQLIRNPTPDLIARITRDDDGAHVIDLLRLLKMTGAEENSTGEQAMKSLYTQTEDFDRHYHDFVSRL